MTEESIAKAHFINWECSMKQNYEKGKAEEQKRILEIMKKWWTREKHAGWTIKKCTYCKGKGHLEVKRKIKGDEK